MIRKTVYFRDEADVQKWEAIENKAAWLHEHLNMAQVQVTTPRNIPSFKTDKDGYGFTQKLDEAIGKKKQTQPKVKLCIHGNPKGECLHKEAFSKGCNR